MELPTINSRYPLLSTTLGCVLSLAIWSGGAWNAPASWADPSESSSWGGSSSWSTPGTAGPCGNTADHDPLWADVKDSTPTQPKPNLEVVWPNNKKELGYAMHNGAKGGAAFNFLFIPTIRISGIECPSLITPGSPEYFYLAYQTIQNYLPPGTDWALGIESSNPGSRTYNQLHIHVSRITTTARKDIDRAVKGHKVAENQGQWLTSVISVSGKNFRAWNADTMTHSFFSNLNEHVVQKLPGVTMGDETMLITQNKQGPGFIVLSSDKKSTLNPGAANIEILLNK